MLLVERQNLGEHSTPTAEARERELAYLVMMNHRHVMDDDDDYALIS